MSFTLKYVADFLLTASLMMCTSLDTTQGTSETGTNPIEQKFLTAGLVDVTSIDDTIKVDLVNSDSGNNFFGKDFYGGLERAYLQLPVAKKLSRAQRILNSKHPRYSLLVMDAARPRSVSVAMYEQMKGTRFEKYVANPKRGSMHNYGAAVDVAIVDNKGELLDMGFIPFYKSKVGVAFSYLFSSGDGLSQAQRANRALLKSVMLGAGFKPLAHEWWHFNGFAKSEIRRRFEIIE